MSGGQTDRKAVTAALSRALVRHIDPEGNPRIYWAREVTFGYGTPEQARVDFVQFRPLNNSVSGIEKGDIYCYEIKSCPEDFASPHGHNLIGDYNYYVMTEKTYKAIKDRLPWHAGVYVPDGSLKDGDFDGLRCVRKARRHNREKPLAEVLLMMFRSAMRDAKKI